MFQIFTDDYIIAEKNICERLTKYEYKPLLNFAGQKECFKHSDSQHIENELNNYFDFAKVSLVRNEAIREDKIREENINSTVTSVVYSIAKATEIVLRDLEWIATVETSYSLNAEHFEIALEDFKKHCISIGRNEDRTIYEFKNHFVNWVRIKKQKKQKTVTDKL